jgi:hypothetical protein
MVAWVLDAVEVRLDLAHAAEGILLAVATDEAALIWDHLEVLLVAAVVIWEVRCHPVVVEG